MTVTVAAVVEKVQQRAGQQQEREEHEDAREMRPVLHHQKVTCY